MIMAVYSARWWSTGVVSAVLLLSAGPSRGEEARLAISGYDPVAYFTDGKPVPGQSELEFRWHNARWRFASTVHRDSFAGNPDRYAPQYDGYCAVGVTGVDFAAPHKDTVDPEIWTIIDGKLYLAHGGGPLWDEWREKAAEKIKSANESWKFVKDQAEPVIVGAPCRESPPTVIITTSDGKREVIIGGQAALDGDGRIVGKGDMRAQLEQVGKNVDACLKAAGVSKSDIIWTETSVANKAAFLKNADVWANYLGPERPGSATIETPQLAGPDVLVEIRAVALLK
jgi:enamine deaminase RidA (YjgF/YER057c/UK114 family)